MSTTMKYTLKSSDGDSFEVEESVAILSTTIKHIIDDDCFENGIPLPNVCSKILSKIIEYCKKHVAVEKTEKADGEKEAPAVDLKAWDREFVQELDQATLFDLVMAANYLNIKDLLDLTCQSIADMIKDKTPEEIRTIFNITNDFTEEEEKAVREENSWAFE